MELDEHAPDRSAMPRTSSALTAPPRPRTGPADAVLPAADANHLGVFAALADPTRRRVLEVLVEAGRASATILADQLPVSRQAVVKHLRVLEEAGLVTGVRAGREVLYAARITALEASARWLSDLCATWHGALGPTGGAGREG